MEFKNAKLKIERAKELISEISIFIETSQPYTYNLETNVNTGQRATFSKKNQMALDKIVIRCGEILHNLRSSLDYAYWDVVSPIITDANKQKSIQFPFSKNSNTLIETIQKRFAHHVSESFFNAIVSVKPHAGQDGNILLNLVHEINILDKHKFPTPVGDFTKVSSEQICKQVSDFPKGIVNCMFGQNHRDIVWTNKLFDRSDLGEAVPRTTYLFHKKLDIPVDLVFSIQGLNYRESVVTTLKNMTFEVESTLKVMHQSLKITN